MPSESVAVASLEELGLTEYEARCFVALTRISQGTAKEISEVADVPRSRVYDTVDRLHKRGLVDVQQSEPRKFNAVPTDEALALLRENYDASLDEAETALAQLSTVQSSEYEGVWAVENAQHVSNRVTTLLDEADEHVHFLVADVAELDRDVLSKLAAAVDRGARVVVEVSSAEDEEQVRERVPGVEVLVSDDLQEIHTVEGKWPGKLVMVDRGAVLASGVAEANLPGVTRETAVWTSGPDHGMATWLRELLDDRLEADGEE